MLPCCALQVWRTVANSLYSVRYVSKKISMLFTYKTADCHLEVFEVPFMSTWGVADAIWRLKGIIVKCNRPCLLVINVSSRSLGWNLVFHQQQSALNSENMAAYPKDWCIRSYVVSGGSLGWSPRTDFYVWQRILASRLDFLHRK